MINELLEYGIKLPEKKIMNFRLKKTTIEKLKKISKENKVSMTTIIEYLINERI